MSDKRKVIKCINCGINLRCLKRIQLKGKECDEIIALIAQQIAPVPVGTSDNVCVQCWYLLKQHIEKRNNIQYASSGEAFKPLIVGHQCVCLSCGRSLFCNIQSHFMTKDTELDTQIYFYVAELASPRLINSSDRICHACYLRIQRKVMKVEPKIAERITPKQNIKNVFKREFEIIVKQEPKSCDPLKEDIEETTVEIKQEILDEKYLNQIHRKKVRRQYMDDVHTFNVPLELMVTNENQMESTKGYLDKYIENYDTCDDKCNHNLCFSNTSNLEVSTIILPHYRKTSRTCINCIFGGCTEEERLLIPLKLRRQVLYEHNIYLSPECSVCEKHLNEPMWHLLNEDGNLSHEFCAEDVEHMLDYFKNMKALDFEDYAFMDDKLFTYYLDRSKEEFEEIIRNEPRIAEMHRGRTALTACIIKANTGNSNDKIASLLQIERKTLEDLMSEVQGLLQDKSVLMTKKCKMKKNIPRVSESSLRRDTLNSECENYY